MIRVKREQFDDNGNPVRPATDWIQKAAAATEKAIVEAAGHKVNERLYRDGEVRKALERLFQGKCAYCEARLGTVAPEHVEHYRPKGAVAERADHPGYIWLAYTWNNLYPACEYCNCRRHDLPTWDEPATGPVGGKATSFPLAVESDRAMTPTDDLAREQPLLLDPCSSTVDPEERFRYDPRGEIHARNPVDLQAQATIRICHLRRRRLRDDRARVIRNTKIFLELLSQVKSDLHPEHPAVERLRQNVDEMTRHDAPFAGAARYVVRDPGAFLEGDPNP